MAVRWVEVLQEAGIPDGVVNLVIGGGEEVGNAIVEHPDVALIPLRVRRKPALPWPAGRRR